ncbi:YdeI/OmpD-associated family protein [Microbacterium aurantiacum]|uniref:YdeI/OmpD-associated family protein n=1 Tax=Microbacterium aurantiacum TaxID=162393 RepID=A0ABT8FPY8_9MICO|nr:YdeI/OmpD-associated family protein [Microbacterium aurantiacum]MDN4463265.1 YdeI/OmpD-associated family protein [Microbacterium aurantiacum]
MSTDETLWGEPHSIDGVIEPLLWGRSRYTILRIPPALVSAAAHAGTRRVAGRLDGVEVNLALTRAPVIDDTFVWTGASLLRRMQLEAGDPVRGVLAPVDPDHVRLPHDLAEALTARGLVHRWDARTPSARRRMLVPIESAVTDATRRRRIAAALAEIDR